MTEDIGEFDFETKSEAGYVWVEETNKYTCLPGASQGKKGLGVVNAAAYSEHPSTEVLTLSYRFPWWWCVANSYPYEADPDAALTGRPYRGLKYRWRPGQPLPEAFFACLAAGGLFEAHNVMFERLIWANTCTPKYGWPHPDQWFYQLRCSMAKARVNSLPGALADLSTVLELPAPKDKDGKRLLDKFSVPHNPTKKDPSRWTLPEDDPEDFARLEAYCDRDLDAESGASCRMDPMDPDELEFWLIDQEMNWAGLAIDRPAVRDCIAIMEQALERYGAEVKRITGGIEAGQLEALRGWLTHHGFHLPDMRAETIEGVTGSFIPLPPGMPAPPGRRVLEIRELIGSASVKKLYAMENQACRDDRLRNLITHHGAITGRPTGEGPQPLNLPKAGPQLSTCDQCAKPFKPSHAYCPWCLAPRPAKLKVGWKPEMIDHVLAIIGTRSLDTVEHFFGDAMLCISGCIRGLFVAGPGKELMASDYTAIEAVVTAMLSKCQWRIDTFREGKPIYLVSASKLTGKTVEFYLQYQKEHDAHHPDRQAGKISELSNGFGGWIGAWRATEVKERIVSQFNDDEVKANIIAWRDASPEIPELWGGQTRGLPWRDDCYPERYGFEGAAVNAIQYPGQTFTSNGIHFYMHGRHLKVQLLSGRKLTYREARLVKSTRTHARDWEWSIYYMRHNTNPKYGAFGWVPMNTYGPKLAENIIQAIAHDIQRYGIKALRLAGYPVRLHVYDENVAEIPIGTGSLEEFERIMSTLPPWAADWPILAQGGWRGRRYRKG